MKKLFDYFEIISVAGIILALSVAFFLLPDREISESENRALMVAPEFSLQKLGDGSYVAELSEYIADQFPLRDAFVGLKAYSETLQFKGENNGVINAGGVLIPRPTNDVSALEKNARAVKMFTDGVDVPVTLVALPRTSDVFSEELPAYYPFDEDKALLDEFESAMSDTGVRLPDLVTPLCESNEYYSTDHHYTTHGAYRTYLSLSDSLGYTPYGNEHFEIEAVSADFCGTAMRTSGFYLNEPDEIVLYRYEGDTDYTVTADMREEISLYDFDKLEATDKYAVFLGGNHARVDITRGEGRPKLLVVRDSYADSLAPFLAMHFDLIMLDYRYFTGSAANIIETEGVSQVLMLHNVTKYCEDENLTAIVRGVKR